MIHVVLSIVSVHWRHIRPFSNSKIQMWPLTALLNVSGFIQGVFVFLAMFGVLWCFLCLLVYDTSCFEYSFGALEAHTSIFEFRNSNLAPNSSFVTVGNAVLDVAGLV